MGGGGEVGESERLTEVLKPDQCCFLEADKVIYEIVSFTKPQDLLLLICTLL